MSRRHPLLSGLLILCLELMLAACAMTPPATERAANSNDSQNAPDSAGTSEAPVVADLETGEHLFLEVCAPCHNQKGTGIEGIGVDLTQSQFVAGLSVPQLAQFVTMGRGFANPFNRTGVKMPPKGGRSDLTDEDVLNIAAYVHGLNTKSNIVQAYLEWLAKGGREDVAPEIEVSGAGLSGPALEGQTTFLRYCAVCHGPHGERVESLGKNLIESDFVAGLNDDDLKQFITVGRSVNDPLNTTGIQMLPFGGQPMLSEVELTNLVAYIRVINIKGAQPEVGSSPEAAEGNVNSDEAWAILDRANPQCLTCHRIADRGNDGPGPHLNGLADVVGDYVPGLNAEEYIRQSIVDPTAFLTPECPTGPCLNVMPNTYSQSLSQDEIDILVKFILSLPPE